jgi:hypothetical protein
MAMTIVEATRSVVGGIDTMERSTWPPLSTR